MEEIAAHRRDFPKILINVGGVKHEVMWRVLEARPLTRLGMLGRDNPRSILTWCRIVTALFTSVAPDLFLKQRLNPTRI